MKKLKVPDCIKTLSKRELAVIFLKSEGMVIVIGYFFYRSLLWILLLTPVTCLFMKYLAVEEEKKKRYSIMLQFKELLVSVNTSIQAGYSLENAFIYASKDMRELYGKDNFIIKELAIITRGLQNNVTIVNLLKNMASKAKVEEIYNFADVMVIAKQSGGKMKEIMDSYIKSIEEKVAVRQEVETMITSRKFEQKIMNVVPFAILVYVNLTSKGFFDVLYHNVVGYIVMSGILVAYLTSIYLANKIIDIEM